MVRAAVGASGAGDWARRAGGAGSGAGAVDGGDGPARGLGPAPRARPAASVPRVHGTACRGRRSRRRPWPRRVRRSPGRRSSSGSPRGHVGRRHRSRPSSQRASRQASTVTHATSGRGRHERLHAGRVGGRGGSGCSRRPCAPPSRPSGSAPAEHGDVEPIPRGEQQSTQRHDRERRHERRARLEIVRPRSCRSRVAPRGAAVVVDRRDVSGTAVGRRRRAAPPSSPARRPRRRAVGAAVAGRPVSRGRGARVVRGVGDDHGRRDDARRAPSSASSPAAGRRRGADVTGGGGGAVTGGAVTGGGGGHSIHPVGEVGSSQRSAWAATAENVRNAAIAAAAERTDPPRNRPAASVPRPRLRHAARARTVGELDRFRTLRE